MKYGKLIIQPDTGRLDIKFSPAHFYGELHCGECFDVKVNRKWIPTRIEMGEDWFLVGVNVTELVGLEVRI